MVIGGCSNPLIPEGNKRKILPFHMLRFAVLSMDGSNAKFPLQKNNGNYTLVSWGPHIIELTGGFDNGVNPIIQQPDGKLLIGGAFTTYNGFPQNRIVRLNPDSSLDTSFDIGTGFNATVNNIAILDDGKILVVGNFTQYNGSNYNRIVKLNPDGTVDSSFNTGTGFNNDAAIIVQQPDGKILICGSFNVFKGTFNSRRIIRLNENGSIDNTFSSGSGFNNFVFRMELQSDGKILLGGQFTSYNGTARNRIARLNSDGTLDTSFNIGAGFNNSVFALELQTDGKIVIGGIFANYNGTARNRIIRLNEDGSIDNTFNPGSGFNDFVNFILQQPDGKLLMCGNFTTYNGTTRNRIIRLNEDGTVDNTFNIGTGFNASCGTVALINNQIFCGGAFTNYNG